MPPCTKSLLFALLAALLGVGLSACSTLAAALPRDGVPVTVELPGAGAQTPLEDAVLYGAVSITAQIEDVREASLYLDDTAATGDPVLSSTVFPMTLALDTLTLSDGPHSLTLRLVTQSGDVSLESIPFTVGNEAFAMLGAVNALRAEGYDCGDEGVFGAAPALRLEARLMKAAHWQADDMNTHGVMTHTGSDGSTVATRVSNAGYSWSRVGENVAKGQKTVNDVVTAWAESDGHCANLMNPGYSEFGAGHAGRYWSQVFATPR